MEIVRFILNRLRNLNTEIKKATYELFYHLEEETADKILIK